MAVGRVRVWWFKRYWDRKEFRDWIDSGDGVLLDLDDGVDGSC